MTPQKKRHEEFMRELRAPLNHINQKNKLSDSPPDESEDEELNLKIMAELERKFDELFGGSSDFG